VLLLQIRHKLVGRTEAAYSQYTCYTGIADFTPPDIDTVGYRVFLGNGKYFVSSDVGGGKMQWCAADAYPLSWHQIFGT
jgi:zeaxanthin epoxidase